MEISLCQGQNIFHPWAGKFFLAHLIQKSDKILENMVKRWVWLAENPHKCISNFGAFFPQNYSTVPCKHFHNSFLSYNHKNGIFSLLSYCFWEGIVGARASRSLSNRHLVFCGRGLDLVQGAWLDLWTKPRPLALGYIPPALTLMMQTFKKQLFSVQIISSLKKTSGLHLFFHTYFFLLLVFVHNSFFFSFVRSPKKEIILFLS